jgi:iron(III) transport system substrate-binding protein
MKSTGTLFGLLTGLICFSLFLSVQNAFGTNKNEVIVYTAVDQVFSEPILQEFEKKTGIRVKAVYDIEATKTTGLVNRLIAEKKNPQCDVFWNNEIVKTIILKRKGVLAPYVSPAAIDIPALFKDKEALWTGFAARARVLVVNRNKVASPDTLSSIFELTQEKWRAKVGMANPLFGTTATHVAALFAVLGKEKAQKYFNDLKQNQIQILDGNSIVKDRAGSGEIAIGFTDSDDVNVGQKAGLPIYALYPDAKGLGTLLIPNTVSLIANSPHPQEARRLIDYLLSKEVEEKLAFCEAVQMPVRKEVKTPPHFVSIDRIKVMAVDFEKMADEMDEAVKYVHGLFIK